MQASTMSVIDFKIETSMKKVVLSRIKSFLSYLSETLFLSNLEFCM